MVSVRPGFGDTRRCLLGLAVWDPAFPPHLGSLQIPVPWGRRLDLVPFRLGVSGLGSPPVPPLSAGTSAQETVHPQHRFSPDGAMTMWEWVVVWGQS